MAKTNTYSPVSIMALICLVMGTIIFTVLIVVASNSIKTTREGSPDDRLRRAGLATLEGDVRKLKEEIQGIHEQIDARERENDRLDLEMIKFNTYMDGPNLLAGVKGEDLTFEGKTYKSKEGEWIMTRDMVTRMKDRLDNWQKMSQQMLAFPELDAAILKHQNQLQEVLTKSQTKDAEFKADQDRLTQQKEALEQEKVKAEKKRREDYGRRATKIGQKEDDIRTLLELELRWVKDLESDATLLEVGSEHKFVVADIGAKDRAMPGQIFEVFQYEQGHYREKGMVEVIDVRDQISVCRIVSEIDPKHYPMAKSDHLGNPVFDKKRAPVFCLAGEFKRFPKSDLEQFIRSSGGEVRQLEARTDANGKNDPRLSNGVDFLIVGDRCEKIQDQAREFQLQAMSEDQLLKYVQTTFGSAKVVPAAPVAEPAAKP